MIQAVSISTLNNQQYIQELESDENFLVQECVRQSRLAQKILYEHNYAKLLGTCLRYCENQAEAEDILHDCFIKIFKVISKFNGTARLSTWLTRLVINEVLMYLRKKKRLPKQTEFDPTTVDLPEISDEELEPYTSNEVFDLIRKLPLGYKEVLCLFSIDGYSHKEIAKALNIAESSSRSQLSRARKILKDKLKIKEVNNA